MRWSSSVSDSTAIRFGRAMSVFTMVTALLARRNGDVAGGSLAIEPRPNGGSCVVGSLPIDRQDERLTV